MRRRFVLGGLVSVLGIVLGCGKDVALLKEKAFTHEQKEFMEIRSLHERQKSVPLIRRGEQFLGHVHEEELRRPVEYYIAVNSEKLGWVRQAEDYYARLLKDDDRGNPWADLARESLRSLRARQPDRSEIS